MTFSKAEQTKHRKAFIEECRQRAWGAACHADWISKSVTSLVADYERLQEQDRKLEADIKMLADALDSHTVDNRAKRKALQEQRDSLGKQMLAIAQNAQKGQQAMQQLLQSVESALALAEHAEKWGVEGGGGGYEP